MTLETLFVMANLSVIPAWLLLILAPKSKVTKNLVHSLVYPITLGAAYVIGIAASMGANSEADMSSLSALSTAFANPAFMLVGWIHYLVFDLFVGAWEARDASRRKVPHLWLVPCLLLTFMLGPTGLLLYLLIRYFYANSLRIEEST